MITIRIISVMIHFWHVARKAFLLWWLPFNFGVITADVFFNMLYFLTHFTHFLYIQASQKPETNDFI